MNLKSFKVNEANNVFCLKVCCDVCMIWWYDVLMRKMYGVMIWTKIVWCFEQGYICYMYWCGMHVHCVLACHVLNGCWTLLNLGNNGDFGSFSHNMLC